MVVVRPTPVRSTAHAPAFAYPILGIGQHPLSSLWMIQGEDGNQTLDAAF